MSLLSEVGIDDVTNLTDVQVSMLCSIITCDVYEKHHNRKLCDKRNGYDSLVSDLSECQIRVLSSFNTPRINQLLSMLPISKVVVLVDADAHTCVFDLMIDRIIDQEDVISLKLLGGIMSNIYPQLFNSAKATSESTFEVLVQLSGQPTLSDVIKYDNSFLFAKLYEEGKIYIDDPLMENVSGMNILDELASLRT